MYFVSAISQLVLSCLPLVSSQKSERRPSPVESFRSWGKPSSWMRISRAIWSGLLRLRSWTMTRKDRVSTRLTEANTYKTEKNGMEKTALCQSGTTVKTISTSCSSLKNSDNNHWRKHKQHRALSPAGQYKLSTLCKVYWVIQVNKPWSRT